MIETYKKLCVCLCLNGHIAALVYLKNNNLPEQIYIDKSFFLLLFHFYSFWKCSFLVSVPLYLSVLMSYVKGIRTLYNGLIYRVFLVKKFIFLQ